MFNSKFLLLSVLSFIFLINTSSCNDNKETENEVPARIDNEQPQLIAEARDPSAQKNEESAAVYVVNSIGSAPKGKVPDFSWQENGNDMSFAELTDGKLVFLNFWGTWCPPCRRELPDIVELHKEAPEDVVVVGIALEHDPTMAARFDRVQKFAKAKGLPYRNFVVSKQDVSRGFGPISAVPTTMIIDKEGNIAETLIGMKSKAAFQQAIDRVRKLN